MTDATVDVIALQVQVTFTLTVSVFPETILTPTKRLCSTRRLTVCLLVIGQLRWLLTVVNDLWRAAWCV